jgi:cytochrome d ubiquinol oxidase subunit II
MEPLHLLWFALLGVLLAGYAILDGFDLGVGILHLCVRKDQERRVLMNSIGPLWDGNEVWLVVFGGALFAAFPNAYAAAFSGFYLPFLLVLCALIFRGVSMEFRSKRPERGWRAFWDITFCAASTLASFLFGVLVANSIRGLPLDANGDFVHPVTVLDLLNPYSILVGIFSIATFAMHGAIYLHLKTEGDLQKRIHGWMWRSFGLFFTLYMLVTIFTLTTNPRSTQKYQDFPWAWAVVVLNVLTIANIPRAIYKGRPLYAFLSSSCTIAAFTFLFGLTLYPNLIVSTIDPDYSLTVPKAASTNETLGIMTVVAVLGLPFVLAYTITVYWVFRGKVQVGRFSY